MQVFVLVGRFEACENHEGLHGWNACRSFGQHHHVHSTSFDGWSLVRTSSRNLSLLLKRIFWICASRSRLRFLQCKHFCRKNKFRIR